MEKEGSENISVIASNEIELERCHFPVLVSYQRFPHGKHRRAGGLSRDYERQGF